MANVFVNINGVGKYFDEEYVDGVVITTEVINDVTYVSVGDYEFNVDGEFEASDVSID